MQPLRAHVRVWCLCTGLDSSGSLSVSLSPVSLCLCVSPPIRSSTWSHLTFPWTFARAVSAAQNMLSGSTPSS